MAKSPKPTPSHNPPNRTDTPEFATQLQQLYQIASAVYQQGQATQAKTLCEQILKAEPKHFDALHLSGAIAIQQNLAESARDFLNAAIAINGNNAYAFNNRGNAQKMLNQWDAALQDYNKAIELDPNFAVAYHNQGIILALMHQHEAALTSYGQAIKLNPQFAEAFFNRAIILDNLRRYPTALADYDQAILLRPHFRTFNNRGNVLQALKRHEEAIASYDEAIRLNPKFSEPLLNRGNALQKLRRYTEATASYQKALVMNPNYPFLLGTVVQTKMQLCDWEGLSQQIDQIEDKIARGEQVTQAFPVLVLSDSPKLQQQAASIYTQTKFADLPDKTAASKAPAKHEKIRIGYFSADFREHAVSYLTAELFESHDRKRFEIIAFSYSNHKKDAMRLRLEQAFDRFFDVQHQSDSEIVALARSLGIDIAVDLGGYTQNNRVSVFALRVAPIQVSYLGYLGTLGASFMDYLLADAAIIPEQSRQYYSEKIVYLPSYQVNDRKREIAKKVFSRGELNLPENSFVFCCFNNNYKITPATFSVWLRILQRVPNSVLWLFAENDQVIGNLHKAAAAGGIAAQRIIFCKRVPRPEYLARLHVADLFLDTFPYNAGTTASDALWAGLPILTCMGESFASRVAASLLTAIHLPELITDNYAAYENLAVALANNPERLTAIKAKLAQNRLTTPLFDTQKFTKNLEIAFNQMYMRYQSGQPPVNIHVSIPKRITVTITTASKANTKAFRTK